MEYVTEAIGTFIFVSVIMITGNPIAIAVALLAVIYFTQNSSLSSINPAVTFGLWMKNDMSNSQAIYYIIAELFGAACAFFWFKANPVKFGSKTTNHAI